MFSCSTIEAFQCGIKKLKVIFGPIFRKKTVGLFIVDEITKIGPFELSIPSDKVFSGLSENLKIYTIG